MVTEVDHPVAGKLKLFGAAVKHSLTPGKIRSPALLMGQRNRYYNELGVTKLACLWVLEHFSKT